MSKAAELTIKRARIAELMEQQHLSALLLGRPGSVSWALAGAEAHVALNTEVASASILYTPRQDYILANQIEMPRYEAEALPGTSFEPISYPWHEPDRYPALIAELARGGTVGGDIAIPGVQPLNRLTAALRYELTPEEVERLREACTRAGLALENAAGEIAPGMTEFAIAGLIAEECLQRDLTPLVLLVGTDERIAQLRHPLPTHKALERHAMLVISARYRGLIVSLTRLVHFGALPDDLRSLMIACARVDASVIAATQPEARAHEIFARLQAAYAAEGFIDEWRKHHQGGPAGYEGREWFLVPTTTERIHHNQAFAWNPSITGVKSEDTILATQGGPQILTASARWPKIAIDVDGHTIERPAILEVA